MYYTYTLQCTTYILYNVLHIYCTMYYTYTVQCTTYILYNVLHIYCTMYCTYIVQCTAHTMSFKQTLKLHYNDNVIKTFNHSSKLAFKLAKVSCHISFLKSCRDFSITPKGLTLTDPLKSWRSNEILHKAQSLLVTSRLQQFKHDYATTESLYLSLLQQL